MLEVILLQLSPVGWQISVVQEVMSQVVADVSENTATEGSCSHVPIPKDNGMSKSPERYGKDEEQRWRHD
jgi:hypothetical protein